MTTASLWAQVIDAIVARMSDTAGYRSAWSTTSTGIPVYDSLEVGNIGDLQNSFLVIGFAGDPESPVDAGDTGQTIATVGNVTRDEKGVIRCLAVDQRGDVGQGVTAASRTAAFQIISDLDTMLRAGADLGIQARHLFAYVGGLTSITPLLTEGTNWWIEFSVVYEGRI